MPPPKKPKTGLTRVEEYLSEKDLEELKLKTSSESGMTSSDEGDDSHGRQSISPVSSSQDIIKSNFTGKSKRQEDHHPFNNYSSEHVTTEKYRSAKYVGDVKVQRDFEKNNSNNDVMKTENGNVEVKISHDLYKSQELQKNDFISNLKKADSKVHGHPKLRKLESLMIRRQVDSLMDAVAPGEHMEKEIQQKVPRNKEDCKDDNYCYQNSAINLSTRSKHSVYEDIDHQEHNNDISYKIGISNGFRSACFDQEKNIESQRNERCLSSTDRDKYNKPNATELNYAFNSKSRLSPISSLQNMFSSSTKTTPQKNFISSQPESACLSSLPFMYQHKPYSNLHDLCPENNKNPHLATKRPLFLNSVQNINTVRAGRPSILQCEKPLSSINDIKKISQQQAGLDIYQSITHTHKLPELTSSELYEKYMKLAMLKDVGKNGSFLPIYSHDDLEKPPPLMPISSIVSSSNIPWKFNRERVDPGYGDNSSMSSTNSDIPNNRYEKHEKNSGYNMNDKERHNPNQQYTNLFSSSSSPAVSSTIAITTKSEVNYTEERINNHMTSSTSPSVHNSSGINSTIDSVPTLTASLPIPVSMPSPVNLPDRSSSHYLTTASGLTNQSAVRIEELSPQHHLPTPLELPSSTMEEKRKKTVEDRVQGRRCQICNDCASGFHYGVWSCEGCKAFFKRSLQGPVDYVCPSTNTCTIDKQRRKSCQACRLRKCLEMGMSRGNCRKERKSSGPRGPKRKSEGSDIEPFGPSDTKIKRADHTFGSCSNLSNKDIKLDIDSNISPLSISTIAHSTTTQMSPSSSGAPFTPPASSANGNGIPQTPTTPVVSAASPQYNGQYDSARASPNAPQTSQISTSQPPIHPLAEHLIHIDPALRTSGHDNSKPDTETHILTSLMKLADLELVDVINWAKSIPGYTELDLKDRIHLLEVCWMEVLLLGVVWHSLQKTGGGIQDSLHFATDLILDKNRLDSANLSSLGNGVLSCLKEFYNLHINHEEFVLFRSLVLLNSDLSKTNSSEKIATLRNKILDALHYTVIERYHGSNSKILSLLTLLPHTRQLSIRWVTHLISSSASHHLPMFALLKEMVDAQVSSSDFQFSKLHTASGNNIYGVVPPQISSNESTQQTTTTVPSPAVCMNGRQTESLYTRRDSYDSIGSSRRGSPM